MASAGWPAWYRMAGAPGACRMTGWRKMRTLGCGVLAILAVVGLGAGGVFVLRDAVAHGDSLLMAFIVLAIPLLVVGGLLVAGVARIVPALKRHQSVQTVVAIGVAALLGVGVYGLNSGIPTQRPDPSLVRAVAGACIDQPVAGAGLVHTDGSEPNHLVVLDGSGAEIDWTGQPPLAWRPPTVADVELVACIDEETHPLDEVCRYEGGKTATLYDGIRRVRVVAAQSAQELARFVLTSSDGCDYVLVGDSKEIKSSVAWSEVAARLSSLVQTGRYVEPNQPSPSAPPAEVTLRQAIADGLVTARGTGNSLASLELRIESKTDKVMLVTVQPGTLLDPANKATQTMVVIRSTTVDLGPSATETVTLDVACAQMHDDQPGSGDTFAVRDGLASEDLRKLIAGAAFGAAEFRVQQFAVWTIQSNPTKTGYVGIGSFGFGGGPDAKELGQIKAIVRDAGLDPGDYRALK